MGGNENAGSFIVNNKGRSIGIFPLGISQYQSGICIGMCQSTKSKLLWNP